MADGTYTVTTNGSIKDESNDEIIVSFKGDSPTTGDKLRVYNGEIAAGNFHINGYKVDYDGKKAKVIDDEADFTPVAK